MKKLFPVLMLFSMAVFVGCLTSSNDKKDDTGGAGTGGSWKVYGYVKLTKVDGSGIKDVSVKLIQSSKTVSTATTNADGYYEFTKLSNGTYTVTPSKSGYTFVPAEVANVVVGDKDVVVQTIVGTTSGGGGGTDTGTGNGGSNTYLPYKVGATWTYDSVFDPEGLNSKSTMVDKVVGTRVINGKTCWMFESRDMDDTYGWADTSFVRIDGNTAYGFFSASLFAKPALKTARAAKIAKAARALLDSYGDEMPLLKFGLSSGQTWAIYNSGVYLGTSVVITGKSLGTESVTVTAGSFSSCAKIEITVDMTMKDSTGTWISKTVTTSWFAPNVGEVKSSDVITSSDGTDTYTYKTEDTLKSYIIP